MAILIPRRGMPAELIQMYALEQEAVVSVPSSS
jgi:hypothetical protein